jgi:hypothetical protein
MPTMKDPLQIETMKLLDKLMTCSYLCDSDLMSLAMIKNVRYTLRYGISEVSPPAFAALGLMFTAVVGDIQLGSKIGDYANLLLASCETKTSFSRTTYITNFLVLVGQDRFGAC